MKKQFVLYFLLVCFAFSSYAVDERAKVVEVTATAQSSPAKITVKWNDFGDWSSGNFVISRKLKSETTWTTKATVPTLDDLIYVVTPMSWDDVTAVVGTEYDYRIVFTGSTYYSSNITLYGYTSSGIQVPVVESRGGIILLVDNTFQTSLATEIARLQEDLEGDGWNVITKYVSRTATVVSVKKVITDECTATPGIKSLFILGHVPVPYSGNQAPDGHPDHKGAWPADVFYGDLNGTWTDTSISSTGSSADGTRNDNVPGDLKYDQIKLPSDVDLQVGRVDLCNLPIFNSMSELQLMQKYLNKDHDYRKKVFVATERALVFDGFGGYATAGGAAGQLGSNAWRNFPSLVGTPNVVNIDDGTQFHPLMTAGSYKWSYGNSAGSFSSIGNLQNYDATVTFATNEDQGVFMMLFGSYFGDWDSQNCILRQPLGSGTTLTCAWAGSPLWYFQHMGMGEPIGYSIKLTQNNATGGTYYSPAGSLGDNGRGVFIALMGDPTLRNDIVKPVSNVTAAFSSGSCTLNWTASSQSNLGYNVYVKAPGATTYVKANTTPVAGTSYVHSGNTVIGTYKYMVRTLILQTSNTGTYYNMSEGIIKTADLTSIVADAAPPTTPTGLAKGTVTSTTVVLTWNASVNVVGATTYDIYIGGVLVAGSNTTNTTYTATGLTAGTLYSFTVVAKDAFGSAAATGAVTATTTAITVPGTPTAATATGGNAQASVAFTAPVSNGGATITGYTVTSNPGGKVATGASSPLTVTGLTNGQAYTFTVVATNSIGSSSASNTSNSVTPSAAATVSGAPTAVVATAGDVQVSVAFVAPVSNGGSAITAYTVTSSPGAKTATGTTSPLMVTGLTNGQAYTFTVVATNAIGNSAASTASVAVTPVASAPTGAGIATWDLIGINTSGTATTAPVTTKDANLTVSNLTLAAGMGGQSASFANSLHGTEMTSTSLTQSISNNEYLEFTITPASGKKVTVTSIDVCAISQGRTATCSLLSSVGGFAADKVISSIALGTPNEINISNQTLAVTGITDRTSAVTFRFYFNAVVNEDYATFGIGERHDANTTAAVIVNGLVDMTTGASNVNDAMLQLYPNPANDKLRLNFGTAYKTATISILDLQGRSMLSKTISRTQVESLDISSLNSGIYFVKVVADGKVMNSRFVKK